MERLTELIEYYSWKVNELAEGYEIATRYMETGEIKEYNKGCQRIDDTLEALKELQHYKDLEEQGRLIYLPCKVGDTVWKISECSAPSCEKCFNFKMNMTNDCYHDYKARIVELSFGIYMVFHFGETVFLTKEEALAKLKELKGE